MAMSRDYLYGVLVGVVTTLISVFIIYPAVAHADPANCAGLHDPRLCDLTKVYYCPDTGTPVTALTTCPPYVVGPHRAGMPPDDVTPER